MTNLEYYCNKNRVKEIKFQYDDSWGEDQDFQLLCLGRGFRRAFNTPHDAFAPEVKELTDLEKFHCAPLCSEATDANTRSLARIKELEKLQGSARIAELKYAKDLIPTIALFKIDFLLQRTLEWTKNELQKS
jgi:hypothetical protein